MQADRLKERRTNKGLTQKNVAEFLGITEHGYQNYEIGKQEPRLDMLIKLATHLDTSSDYLLGLSDDPGKR